MTFSSQITSKGQVTVPLAIRKRLGLKQGDRLEFVVEQGTTVIRPARGKQNPFTDYIGAIDGFRSRKEINAWVRQLRDE
jgi:AbrB family looped-hinge helix DNA binding protein